MPENQTILAIDCGSTTTKAVLIEKRDGAYRLIVRGEAPTTVEKPFEDVTVGVLNAIRELEDLTGRKLVAGDGVLTPRQGDAGVDCLVATSSAGGGLQMMVAGVIKAMSAESAERAVLGAGALITDVIALDDGRSPHDRVKQVRRAHPDIILVTGGTDGGPTRVVEVAEVLASARPRPRRGAGPGAKVPVIFAGNKDAVAKITELLADKTDLRVTPNLRPTLETENLEPVRDEIRSIVTQHVMTQAPGYEKLSRWTAAPVMPTSVATGSLLEAVGRRKGSGVVGVDLGGATTHVFSFCQGAFNHTASANLGMSYSIYNVLLEAGFERVKRWLPFVIEEHDLENRLRNKMIRPTTVPETLKELLIEQAIAREALAMAFEYHKGMTSGLKGVHHGGTMDRYMESQSAPKSILDPRNLGLLVGSGGILSHAPRRVQAALMLIDAFQPEIVCRLAVDSVFMMPQLGVLATVNPEASTEVFEQDCLVRLGTVLAPVQAGSAGKIPWQVARVRAALPGGRRLDEPVVHGRVSRVDLPEGEFEVEVEPIKGWDAGAGPGVKTNVKVEGGAVGLLLDGRGRPLALPKGDRERWAKLVEWCRFLDAYPEEPLAKLVSPEALAAAASPAKNPGPAGAGLAKNPANPAKR